MDHDNDVEYRMTAIKRLWIPEWVYSLVIRVFGNELPCKQPLRWMLHVSYTEEYLARYDAQQKAREEKRKAKARKHLTVIKRLVYES